MPTSRERVFIQADFPLGFFEVKFMFERTLNLIDNETFTKIQNMQILLVGVGGVGGSVFEGLIRLGFLNITIVDYDIFEESNLNRQLLCTKNVLGMKKVLVAKNRALNINSNAVIDTKDLFVNEENISLVFDKDYDYIIDACDTTNAKYLLVKEALERNIKIISCMGTGKKIDPSKLEITRLDKTSNDALAKKMRNILRKNNLSLKIPVISSKELSKSKNNDTIGSIICVPVSAGMLICSYILNEIKITVLLGNILVKVKNNKIIPIALNCYTYILIL